jgi:hypothetical protein
VGRTLEWGGRSPAPPLSPQIYIGFLIVCMKVTVGRCFQFAAISWPCFVYSVVQPLPSDPARAPEGSGQDRRRVSISSCGGPCMLECNAHSGKAPFPLFDRGWGPASTQTVGDDNGWWGGLKNRDKTLTRRTPLGKCWDRKLRLMRFGFGINDLTSECGGILPPPHASCGSSAAFLMHVPMICQELVTKS